MGTRANPGKFDCYHLALPNEPQFTLLARDPIAPALVQMWADARRLAISTDMAPQSDMEMVTEAEACAAEMIRWRAAHLGEWRLQPLLADDEAQKQVVGGLSDAV